MALILKENKSFSTSTGAVCKTAYLKCNPFDTNDKDQKMQTFRVCVYNSDADKQKQPVEIKQIAVFSDEYETWFSPAVLSSGKNLQNLAYEYLLSKAKEFEWMQGDIWVSDE